MISHLDNPLHHGDAFLLLEPVTEELASLDNQLRPFLPVIATDSSTWTHLLVVRRVHARLGQDALEDKVNGDTTRYADQLGHGLSAAVPVTVRLQGGGDGLFAAIGTDHFESVLQQDNVDLSGLKLACVLESGRKGAHDAVAGLDGLVREEAELTELGNEDTLLLCGEGAERLELGDDRAATSAGVVYAGYAMHSLLVGLGANQLGSQFNPFHRGCVLAEIVDGFVAQKTNLLPGLDNLAEASVPDLSAAERELPLRSAYRMVPLTRFWHSGML